MKSNKLSVPNNFDKGHSYMLFYGYSDGLLNIYETHCCSGHNVNIIEDLKYCLDAIFLHVLKRSSIDIIHFCLIVNQALAVAS